MSLVYHNRFAHYQQIAGRIGASFKLELQPLNRPADMTGQKPLQKPIRHGTDCTTGRFPVDLTGVLRDTIHLDKPVYTLSEERACNAVKRGGLGHNPLRAAMPLASRGYPAIADTAPDNHSWIMDRRNRKLKDSLNHLKQWATDLCDFDDARHGCHLLLTTIGV